MTVKRLLALFLVLCLACLSLVGCTENPEATMEAITAAVKAVSEVAAEVSTDTATETPDGATAGTGSDATAEAISAAVKAAIEAGGIAEGTDADIAAAVATEVITAAVKSVIKAAEVTAEGDNTDVASEVASEVMSAAAKAMTEVTVGNAVKAVTEAAGITDEGTAEAVSEVASEVMSAAVKAATASAVETAGGSASGSTADTATEVISAVVKAVTGAAVESAGGTASDSATEAAAEAVAGAISAVLKAVTETAAPAAATATATGETAGTAKPVAAPEYRIAQDRVIELTYSELDEEAAVDYMKIYDYAMGGCSAVRLLLNDKVYVGRNYDFYCSDSPAIIVHNNAGKIRTVGIGNSPNVLDPWTDSYELNEAVAKVLPFICCDVMSEAGLYCETNIRPFEEGLQCASTNPGAPRRCTQMFMQLMLSQYATIDEILEHLNDYDWYDLKALNFEQSFFLTDQSGRSVIIEFGANRVMWQDADYNANFFINDELYAIEKLGCGELRLDRELAYKPFVLTEEDIFTMMEQGAYSQFYATDVDVDYAIPEYYDDTGYNRDSVLADPEGARAATAEIIKQYSSRSWEEHIQLHDWESVFIVAANVTDLYMNVHFSEHYGIAFTVSFQ